jgi:multidrug efflux pump subunit AcrA (membrane-fusion protein)
MLQNDETKNKAYESAKEAQNTAAANLEKLKADKGRAEIQAEQDAAEQLKSAQQSVGDAQTNLEKAITNLSRARAEHNRQIEDSLIDLKLKQINADMNKNSNASISNAEFTLEEAKLNLAESENNLEHVKLYAPINGQVLSISRGVGESVTAQSGASGAMFFGTGGSANNFITVCDITKIYLTASITEGDIISVSKGQTIRVDIDAIGGEVFYGIVTNVDNIPATDANGITTYSVSCLLNDTSDIIKDGMNAYITFIQREHKNVLLIPNKAVFMENEMQHVNVVKPDGSYEKRKVVCGLSNGVQTEVISGLAEGETVLAGRVN